MTTGQMISDLMKKHGYSRAFMANYLDVSTQTVTNYCSGGRLPDAESLFLLAILFEKSIEDLLDTQDMMFSVIDAKMRLSKWLETHPSTDTTND